MSSLVTALAFPRTTIPVKGIPLFHFENAFLAEETPHLARFVLDAVHHRMFVAAVRADLGFAHRSQTGLHILEPFVGKKVGSPKREIPLGGPSRTEAEHPQPRIGQIGIASSCGAKGQFFLAYSTFMGKTKGASEMPFYQPTCQSQPRF